MLQPLQDWLGHQLYQCFGTSLIKMANVTSYTNDLFITISFNQTRLKVIIITINPKKGHSVN